MQGMNWGMSGIRTHELGNEWIVGELRGAVADDASCRVWQANAGANTNGSQFFLTLVRHGLLGNDSQP